MLKMRKEKNRHGRVLRCSKTVVAGYLPSEGGESQGVGFKPGTPQLGGWGVGGGRPTPTAGEKVAERLRGLDSFLGGQTI